MPESTVHYNGCVEFNNPVRMETDGRQFENCICEYLMEHTLGHSIDVGDRVSFLTPEGPKRVIVTSIMLQSRVEQEHVPFRETGHDVKYVPTAARISQTIDVRLEVVNP
jgi:hypothetical protein